jgi:hypothetical protein
MTDKKASEETAAADVADADFWAGVKGGSDVKFAFSQVKTWIKSWIAKGDVGLGNVDNTADASKPVSTAQQTALDLKANLASPTFTGTPAAPTASAGTNTTQLATTAFVKAAIDAVLGGVSSAFDTLSEIAASLGTAGQRPATATNDSASAGNVGEIITSTIVLGSAVSLTAGSPANVTSISLTAGDWDVSAGIGFIPATTTSVTQYIASCSASSATLDTVPGRFFSFNLAAYVPGASQQNYAVPTSRFSLNATTTVYLVAQSNFTVSTMGAFGIIRARRAR